MFANQPSEVSPVIPMDASRCDPAYYFQQWFSFSKEADNPYYLLVMDWRMDTLHSASP